MKILNSYPRTIYYINTDIGKFRVGIDVDEPLEIFDHCEWKIVNPGLDISNDDFYSILDCVRTYYDN